MMVNKEHVHRLQEGAKAWNQWRCDHENVLPDLSGGILSGADLNGANLSHTILSGADLNGANLLDADLSFAVLSSANLNGAFLNCANLNGADLNGASLSRANLTGADLSCANLRSVVLYGTIFSEVDLRQTKGLLEIQYIGPSIINLHSIQLPQDGSALHFLRGAGVPDEWIDFYRATIQQPIQYHSCFISYSSKDEAFAKRLYADLQEKGVRCWFAPEDLKIGKTLRTGIDEAIHFHEKLLLILSKYSVTSGWVEHEVKTALTKERKEKREMLFPLRVDKAVLESPLSWATKIRHERSIGDFTRWKDHDEYQKAFTRLLRGLTADSQKREGES